MQSLVSAYDNAKVSAIKSDFIDRLHSKYSVIIIFAICILIGLRQYHEDGPIVCWLPTHFSDAQVDYSHQLCWINNTYFYPDQKDADLFPESLKYVLPYYQFILFILFGQGLLFYFPSIIWNHILTDSTSYINKLLDQIAKEKLELSIKKIEKKQETELPTTQTDSDQLKANPFFRSVESPKVETITEEEEARLLVPSNLVNDIKNALMKKLTEEKLEQICEDNVYSRETRKLFNTSSDNRSRSSLKVNLIKRFSSLTKETKKKISNFMKPIKGVQHLAFYYMGLKVFNLVNVLTQLFFLHFIFGSQFYRYGIDFFIKLINNQDPFYLSRQFPIITFCDFFVYQNLRQLHSNSAQCVLSINIFIEKFFVIIWFWLIFLIIMTTVNIFSWVIELSSTQNLMFILKYLRIKQNMSLNYLTDNKEYHLDENLVKKFYKYHLGRDGVIMLHMVKVAAGDIKLMELLFELWKNFIDARKNYRKLRNQSFEIQSRETI
jgi:hypothetical protein